MPCFSTFLCFLLMSLLFKTVPRIVLNSCPVDSTDKTGMCLMEKILVLDKLHWRMSYSADGCKFDINELTIHIK